MVRFVSPWRQPATLVRAFSVIVQTSRTFVPSSSALVYYCLLWPNWAGQGKNGVGSCWWRLECVDPGHTRSPASREQRRGWSRALQSGNGAAAVNMSPSHIWNKNNVTMLGHGTSALLAAILGTFLVRFELSGTWSSEGTNHYYL